MRQQPHTSTTRSMPRQISAPGIAAVALLGTAVAVVLLALLWGQGEDMRLIMHLRVPRVLAAAGVGALLALAGLAMQVVLRNPLADPYVLGTSGGASMGALLGLSAGFSLWAGAAMGAIACAVLLLWLARAALRSSDDASPRLILLGAMLAAWTGAMSQLLLTLTPDTQLRGAVFWLSGDLSGAEDHGLCLGLATCFALALMWGSRSVDRLMLGSEAAALLGERVAWWRAGLLCGAAVAVAAAVATAGAIGFVGLVVPHALRLARVHGVRAQAALCALGGALVLVAADVLARSAASPLELPVGAIMALIGAPVFIWFLWRDL